MREVIKNDVPELWRQRYKSGICPVCGKDKSEFEKCMKVFCCVKCREEYSTKYTSWTEVRDKILKRDQYTCKKCGANQDKHNVEREEKIEQLRLEFVRNNPEILNTARDEALVRLSERFEEDYMEIMDDKWLIEKRIQYRYAENFNLPYENIELEVDHITAISNGGDMWDEENLQTLCKPCHREKTTEDMRQQY